ncbi:hypothetical protein CRN76_20635 [Chryseobacterium indologenes]|nr:hypothetical protein CRN76_20635 [Chryseobacterium indologenes]AYY83627.1 hypothetical protein EGX91_03190 [Chryseobacterium indologenes]HAO28746.1 hypothetical protein [Chryseobacterium indologenes]
MNPSVMHRVEILWNYIKMNFQIQAVDAIIVFSENFALHFNDIGINIPASLAFETDPTIAVVVLDPLLN